MLVEVTREQMDKLPLEHLKKLNLCHVNTENYVLNNNEKYYVFQKNNRIVGFVILEITNDVSKFIKEKQFDEFLKTVKGKECLILKQVAFDFKNESKLLALEFTQSVFGKYQSIPYISLVRITKENEKFVPYLQKYYSNYKLLKNYWENKDIRCNICQDKCLCKSILLLKEANVNPLELNITNLTNMLVSSLFK